MEKYIISLKKDHNKCVNSINLLNNAGINNIKIFEAINGNELIPTVEKIGYKHPYIQVNLSSLYDLRNGRKRHREISSKGALGCYLSHITLWNKLINSINEYMLIFEDDVEPLVKDANVIINNIIKEKNDFDILLLGYTLKDNNIISVSENLNKCMLFFGLHSYIITKKGAEKLLKHALPIDMQLDSYIPYYNLLLDKNFNTYCVKNKLFTQSFHKSNIQTLCQTCYIIEYYDKYFNNKNVFFLFIIFFLFYMVRNRHVIKIFS